MDTWQLRSAGVNDTKADILDTDSYLYRMPIDDETLPWEWQQTCGGLVLTVRSFKGIFSDFI